MLAIFLQRLFPSGNIGIEIAKESYCSKNTDKSGTFVT
jgi:hypothetical protein